MEQNSNKNSSFVWLVIFLNLSKKVIIKFGLLFYLLEVSIEFCPVVVELLEDDCLAVLGFVMADDVSGGGDSEDQSVVAWTKCNILK